MVKAWKIIVAAIAFLIIAQVIHMIEAQLTMDYYIDPAYATVWSKIMMPKAGPPPVEFYYYSWIFTFITGLIFAGIYAIIEKALIAGIVIAKILK